MGKRPKTVADWITLAEATLQKPESLITKFTQEQDGHWAYTSQVCGWDSGYSSKDEATRASVRDLAAQLREKLPDLKDEPTRARASSLVSRLNELGISKETRRVCRVWGDEEADHDPD